MKVLIVDDEHNARAALTGMISAHFPDITIVGEAKNVPEAVKAIHKHKPDVVLLDIEMPGYLGVDIFDFFDEDQINFKIIFITAYNDYALKAFELAAVDYLLKPTRVEQLERAFSRIKERKQDLKSTYKALTDNLKGKKFEKIAISISNDIKICALNDIRFFKADGSYTHIHFKNGDKLTTTKNLQEYNVLEETGLFYRVNRSYIINVDCIELINKKTGGWVILDEGEEISISAAKREQLLEYFDSKL